MDRVPTFRDQAKNFRQLARESADPAVSQAALEVADRLDRLAQAVEDAVTSGGAKG